MRFLPVLFSLTAVAAFAVAKQTRFSAQSTLPPLDPSHFPNHTLLSLNDGTFVPSPAFGVGSAFFRQNATEAVRTAIRTGYRHFDNAAVYGNEESVGDALRLEGIPRKHVYITSKYDHLEGKDVETEFQESLKKLGVSYLDLYLIHFPKAVTDPRAVWTAFESLVSRSLVRSIGVSNYDVTELAEILSFATIPPAVNQIRYHLYNQRAQAPAVALGRTAGILTAAYSSLTPLTKEPGGPVDPVLDEIANEKDLTGGQVILEWVKSKGILAVTTSGKAYRQKESLDVFGDSDLPSLHEKDIVKLERAGLKGELEDGY